MKISSSVFPEGVAGAIANPAVLGSITSRIFSYPSSILRILGAYGIIKLYHQSTQPVSPTSYSVWCVPATIESGYIVESDVKIYDGTGFVEPTKALWEKALSGNTSSSASTIIDGINDIFLDTTSNQQTVNQLTSIVVDNISTIDGGEI